MLRKDKVLPDSRLRYRSRTSKKASNTVWKRENARMSMKLLGLVVLFASGCSAPSGVVIHPIECEVSDQQISEFATAAAKKIGVEIPSPLESLVEIYRYEGRLGYIATRYLGENKALEMHRELIIWMRCDGTVDSVHVGQSLVYSRCRLDPDTAKPDCRE